MVFRLAVSIMTYIIIGAFAAMLLTSWYYIADFLVSLLPIKMVPRSNKYSKFAVIIPARYESNVIHRPLQSLLNQSYQKKYYDIWVIIESKNDPTYEICKKYGVNCFIRQDLENKHTKGFAIQELIKHFKAKHLRYDAYMIFDADNVVSRHYLSVMNDLRQTGVQVGLGYRNYTNASRNWLTSTSAVFFTYMMSFTAQMRSNLFKKSSLCGTGYYINADIIDDAGGWIFTGMTEDVELTNYCYYHDVWMRYYPLVEFFDEQCSTFKASHHQMIRWIMGYFTDKSLFRQPGKNYQNTSPRKQFWAKFEYNVGVYPFVIFSVCTFLTLCTSIGFSVASIWLHPELTQELLFLTLTQFCLLYGMLVLVGLAVMLKNYHRLKFNLPTFIWTLFTYPLFYLGLFFAFVDGLINKKKRKTWERINHTGEVTNAKVGGNINEKTKLEKK